VDRAMIALMMEVVRTSETSVNFNVTTRRYIPEDSKLLTVIILEEYFYELYSYVTVYVETLLGIIMEDLDVISQLFMRYSACIRY
jgi:hypothetical protein